MSEIEERIEPVLTKMIQKCCDIKRQVVENDPTEQGERAVLNLGHTIGHAIEKLKNFELTPWPVRCTWNRCCCLYFLQEKLSLRRRVL